MKLLFVGDMSLHDWQAGDLLPLPAPGHTRVFVNLESPIGTSFSRGTRLPVGAPAGALMALESWSGQVAALANNHLLDAGDSGAGTIRELERLGIEWVGARGRAFIDVMVEEQPVRVFNWVTTETTPGAASESGPCHFPSLEEGASLVSAASAERRTVIVYLHWSNELIPYPTPEDRHRAHVLARAGADAIVGTHPHVVRGGERIGKTRVFYSLGNYHFGDMRNAAGDVIVKQVERTNISLGVELAFERSGLAAQTRSFRRRGRHSVPDPANKATRLFDNLSIPLRLPPDGYAQWYERWMRYQFHFERIWHFRRHEVPLRKWPVAAYRLSRQLGRGLVR
jgi:hypothetical protein